VLALTLGADEPPVEEQPIENVPLDVDSMEPAPLATVHPYTSHIPGRRDLGLQGTWAARANVGGSEKNPAAALEVPLSLAYGFDNGAKIRLEAPLSLRDDALSAGGYSGDLRLSLGLPVASGWSLRPSVRVGVAGPMEPVPGRRIVSGRLTSHLQWPVRDNLKLSLGTTGEALDTMTIGGVSDGVVDLSLRNRLGLALKTGLKLFGGGLDASAAFTDIRRLTAAGLDQRAEVDLGISTGGRLKLGASARIAQEAEEAEAGVRARLFTRF
jgi:hypothetical protein